MNDYFRLPQKYVYNVHRKDLKVLKGEMGACMVIAESAAHAREIASEMPGKEGADYWFDPTFTKVNRLGTCKPNVGPSRVIMRDIAR